MFADREYSGLRALLVVWFLLAFFNYSSGQKPFNGSFLMSFQTTGAGQNEYPLFWNILAADTGMSMALEIQDEMKKKGVSKRVLFQPKDSTWTMMMEYNKVKQGSRIHAAKMFRETDKLSVNVVVKKTAEKKIIDGYLCTKSLVSSEKYRSEVWITDKINFNLPHVYHLLSHCGMINEVVRMGDWYKTKKIRGMILETKTTEIQSGKTYTMIISAIRPDDINPNFFSTRGFMISDIPEGQSCGKMVEEK